MSEPISTAQSPPTVQACPRCGQRYGAEARFCPVDGVALQPVDPLVGTVLLGQIELQGLAGRGSMGTVYHAWQRTMERRVAVKILHRKLLRDAQVVKRFQREARAAAKLSHPNIITVYLIGETPDGLPFIVMEFVEGKSLEDALDERPLAPARAVHIARQVAAALIEAHEQGIVHRDLKPANILLTQKRDDADFVKILDFGIAKILRDGGESRLTKTGAIFGTPYFLSPEQAAGEEVDHRCDLYSLGVLLYRMLTGWLPFFSESAVEVLVKHLKEEPRRPREIVPTLTPELEALVMRAMAKHRDERWQTAQELDQALQRVAATLAPAAAFTPVPAALPAPAAAEPLATAEPREARFRVPSDSELGAVSAPLQPTLDPVLVGPPGVPPAASTDFLRRAALGTRRRVLLHLAIGAVSLVLGGAAGALLHKVRRPRAAATVAPPLAVARTDARSLADARAASPDAALDGAADAVADTAPVPDQRPPARPATRAAKPPAARPRPQPRRRGPAARRRPTPRAQPVASEPEPAPVAPVGPAPEHPTGEEPSSDDEIYDLVQ